MDNTKKARILIAEDDELAIDALQGFLSQWYEVGIAKTGEDAVTYCQKNAPDLVIMDLMMPGSGKYEGDEAIRVLTTDPKTSKIPLIIQTGFKDTRVLVLMAQAPNIVGILVKPLDLPLLKQKIEFALRAKA